MAIADALIDSAANGFDLLVGSVHPETREAPREAPLARNDESERA
jgi:hypothetical protein